jgi:hypothetical protein
VLVSFSLLFGSSLRVFDCRARLYKTPSLLAPCMPSGVGARANHRLILPPNDLQSF